jgi:hypothetical protein
MRKGLHILVLLLAVSCPALSFSDPVRMSIQPNGKGSFFLTGENVIGVQALDIAIDYDSSLLTQPSVMINGGDLRQVKADTPGTLFISIYRSIADALLQVIVNFETEADVAGGIYHISAVTRSTTKWPPESDADPFSSTGGADDASAETPADTAPNGGAVATAPGESVPTEKRAVEPQNKERTDAPAALKGVVSPGGADKKVYAAETKFLRHEEKSVLQRFKKFRGEKSMDAFVALFGPGDSEKTRQEPEISLSDGKTAVTISMDVQWEESHHVEIALSDARLITKEANEKGVVVTVLPSEGTWDARLIVVAGKEILYYPIVVAPPVIFNGSINAGNFLDALQAYVNSQSPVLQRESKLYLSEYIFTANYLAGLNRKARSFLPRY